MVMPRGGVIAELEKKLGLPKFSQIASSLEKLPDDKQLKLIRDTLTVAERVSKSAPELDQVAAIMREINSMPVEKLEWLEKILKRVDKILKNAPQDLLGFLSSLKEE